MPRANRYHVLGYIWHLTHRCHKKEFLLKFAKDRRRWIAWLLETEKRFGLRVLNFTVTCNHRIWNREIEQVDDSDLFQLKDGGGNYCVFRGEKASNWRKKR